MCVGAYGVLLALTVIFIATASGDMSGLLIVIPALPWPIVAHWIFRDAGLWIGTLLGLPLNGFLAFSIGYGISRRRLAKFRSPA